MKPPARSGAASGPAEPPVISVRSISKRYGRTLAIKDFSLDVRQGEQFALLGPNGAGKTTLLHILCTILQPDSGTAEIAGHDVARSPQQARQNIGVVFQEPSLDDRLTTFENLEFHGLVYGVDRAERRARIDEMLALVELSDWRQNLVRTLSSGMKRRLEIARALLHRPRILFLDEPTVGLDAQSRERIWRYLETLRATTRLTLVVTTHYIEEVESCDRVCIVDHGEVLAQGTPQELKARFGRELVRVQPRDEATRAAMRARYPDAVDGAGGALIVPVTAKNSSADLLEQFGGRIREIAFDTPSLENVFLSLTGKDLRDKAADQRERMLAFGRRGGEHTR